MADKLLITYEKSVIGRERRQRATIRALGFRKLMQTVEHNDTPVIRGMINRVKHLVSMEEVNG
jgi:large subunit ribosomal protein L30